MAMIKCSECGREISDKAPACIYCGCPMNFAALNATPVQPAPTPAPVPTPTVTPENTAQPRILYLDFYPYVNSKGPKSTQKVFVKELNRNVEFDISNFTTKGAEFIVNLAPGSAYDKIVFKALTASLPPNTRNNSEEEEAAALEAIANYKPNFLVKFFGSKIIAKFIGMFLVFLIGGRLGDVPKETLVPIVMYMAIFLFLGSLYPFANIKKYFKKHGIDKAIKNDTGNMSVAIAAFNIYPYRKMFKYIGELNFAASKIVEQETKNNK